MKGIEASARRKIHRRMPFGRNRRRRERPQRRSRTHQEIEKQTSQLALFSTVKLKRLCPFRVSLATSIVVQLARQSTQGRGEFAARRHVFSIACFFSFYLAAGRRAIEGLALPF